MSVRKEGPTSFRFVISGLKAPERPEVWPERSSLRFKSRSKLAGQTFMQEIKREARVTISALRLVNQIFGTVRYSW